jgi:hypothetical protein
MEFRQGPMEDLVNSRAIGFPRHWRRRDWVEHREEASTPIPWKLSASPRKGGGLRTSCKWEK